MGHGAARDAYWWLNEAMNKSDCLSVGVGRDAQGLDPLGFHDRARFVFAVFERGADEGGEQRMRLERLGFEFGMELAAEVPRMVGDLADLQISPTASLV